MILFLWLVHVSVPRNEGGKAAGVGQVGKPEKFIATQRLGKQVPAQRTRMQE
jgi:hypothetical protein